jgi:hypothetical protein
MRELLEKVTASEDIEQTSELLKERIYSTITLLALLTTMWQAGDHFTHQGALVSVIGTAMTLWLAIAVASRMSHQVVYGRRMDVTAFRKILAVRKALVAPAIPPAFFISMSWVGFLSLQAAFVISIIALLLSFALYSLLAGLRIHTTWYEIIFASILEVAIGAAVVVLKIVVGH